MPAPHFPVAAPGSFVSPGLRGEIRLRGHGRIGRRRRASVGVAIGLIGWCQIAAAQEPEPSIHVAAHVGCRQWPVLERIFRIAGSGDEAAANALFNKSARHHGCVLFRAGERVFVGERRHSWRQLRLRREGDPVEYWAVVLGDRLPHRLNQWAVVE